MIPALQALGHAQVAARRLPLKANGAQFTAAGWVGAADPRTEGTAVRE
jgi:gamma-glutamyltranspeptidase/glutathione hydrolase